MRVIPPDFVTGIVGTLVTSDSCREGRKSDQKLAIDGGPTYYKKVCWAQVLDGKDAATSVSSEVSPLVLAP
jgi:hypothetical protein